jgi:hypothetical protein
MKKKKIVILAGILTVLIYFLGFLTGYFLQSNILSLAEKKLKEIREEFENYRERLDNLQLQQLYLITYGKELKCELLLSIMDEMHDEFVYFWNVLPAKLEVYEKYSEIQPEYVRLKRDYTMLTIRGWLLWQVVKEKCNATIVPALYFYSKDCKDCINQSYVLDELRKENLEFAAFIVDYQLDEPIVRIIKKAYNVTEVPSFIVDGKVYSGLQNLTQLKEIIAKHR